MATLPQGLYGLRPPNPVTMALVGESPFGAADPVAALRAYAATLPPGVAAGPVKTAASGPDWGKIGDYLLTKSWPSRMVQAAWGAATLPGDVYAGKVDPNSDEGIARANDLAGLVTLGSGAVPGGGLRAGASIKRAPSIPKNASPTDTGWIFKDVSNPHPLMDRGDWRKVTQATETGAGVLDVELPIRSINATQKTVNPDFSNTISKGKNDKAPFVIKKGGQYFLQDGHHRLVDAAMSGRQTARVRLLDLDGTTQTDFPLLPDILAAGGKGGRVAGAAELAAAGAAERPGIRVYHGSPHDFDKFSMEKIGTGEGAQSYGHGLYFAEAEDVGKRYRDSLAHKASAIDIDGERISPVGRMATLPAKERAAVMLRMAIDEGTGPAAALMRAKNALRNAETGNLTEFQRGGGWGDVDVLKDVVRYLENWQDKDIKPVSGKMYEARINASPDEFLDWDKPVFKQSDAVKKAVYEAAAAVGEKQIEISRLAKNPAFAEELRKRGIKGIRYLDQGSRGAGEGSRNYVVFDDNIIDILRKYGIAGLIGGAAGAGAMMQPGGAEAATMPEGLYGLRP